MATTIVVVKILVMPATLNIAAKLFETLRLKQTTSSDFFTLKKITSSMTLIYLIIKCGYKETYIL